MKYIAAFFEVIEALFTSNKKQHASKKLGGAVAKNSLKKLRKAF